LGGQRSGSSLAQVRGVSGGGLSKESPATARAEAGFSDKNAKNTYIRAEAHGIPQTPVVVVPMMRPSGNGNGKVEAR